MFSRIKQMLFHFLNDQTLEHEEQNAHLYGGYAQYATDSQTGPATPGERVSQRPGW